MADSTIDKSALQEAVKLGLNSAGTNKDEKVHFALVTGDTKAISLKEFQYPQGVPPDHIVGTVVLRDAKSFCSYFQAFADDRARVFAEPANQTFLAVIDYHGAGERVPEFCSHRASFAMVKDERWAVWAGNSEKIMKQGDFAEFLEDNAADILDPNAAAMLEIARDLKATSSGNFESKVVPKNGTVQMKYTETVDGKVGSGDIEIPEFFKISIPIFYNEEKIVISARLRYRITAGNLTFFYKLYRQSELLNDAFNKAVASVADVLKREVLLGSPGV